MSSLIKDAQPWDKKPMSLRGTGNAASDLLVEQLTQRKPEQVERLNGLLSV